MKSFTAKKTKKAPWLIWILLALMIVLVFVNFIVGSSSLSVKELFADLGEKGSVGYTIFVYLRLPRTLACLLVGASLAVAGLLLQTMLNNSLASPGIIGINSGAGLAVVVTSIIVTNTALSQTISTFIGAFLSAMLIYAIGRVSGTSRGKLILAGIAVSRLFSALIDAIVIFDPTALSNRAAFQLGSLAKVNLTSIYFAGPIIIVGIVMAIVISRYMGLLTLGDDVATSLGLNVKLCRFFCLLAVALLSAGAVSLAGLLSFLGLIAPHIVKRIVGTADHTRLTIITMVFGADLTLLCDLLSRTVFMPYEIPVGIIMSVIGVPFFIFLLFNKKGGKDRFVAN